MEKIANVSKLSREEWLELRKKGIGGSDAAAACGLNPWKSKAQLYFEKTGQSVKDIDNEILRQGRDLEDYVAKRFTEATGCLLYTSPSPRDGLLSRMPSSA